MAEEEITVKDLAEWENDFQDELSNCFWGTDVEIQFVSEEHWIIKNVEPTVNEESITAASSATKTTRKSLQLLKLPKDIQDIDCKDILVKSIGLLENDRNYFIGPAQIIQLRKTELDILKTFCLSMNYIHIVNAIVTHMYVILSSFTSCTLFSVLKERKIFGDSCIKH